jgi:hypothetical protein
VIGRIVSATVVAVVIAGIFGGAATLSSNETKQPANHLIRVGPKVTVLSENGPAYLSIQKKNTIRWIPVPDGTLMINFPIDDFPTLADGTRVTLPPLEGMVLNGPKTKWFNGGASGQTGQVNAALQPLLQRAKGHELVYPYRIILGSEVGHGVLVVQE